MNRFQTHYSQIVSYDLITKFPYQNSFQIPQIQEIAIHMGSIHLAVEKKKIISLLLALELITGQPGHVTLSKKNKIHLKIKKGMIIGCKITLNRANSYHFLENLLLFVFPHMNDFKGFSFHSKAPGILSFQIHQVLNFFELNSEFLLFSQLPSMDISIKTDASTLEESTLLLNAWNFPVKMPAKVSQR